MEKLKNICFLCWIPLALLALWLALGAYWYTCKIKGICDIGKIAPIVLVETLPSPLTLYFSADSDSIITKDAEVQIDAIVSALQNGSKAHVVGHTNVYPNHSDTDALGLERAEKVKALLVSLGASADSISLESKGQRELAVPPTSSEARALNRRVVITIIK